MKIGLVCPYNLFRGGGVQIHVENLASGLRDLGHTVKIIAPNVSDAPIDRDDVILLGKCTQISFNKTQTEVSVVLGRFSNPVKEMLKREKFDILHFHEPWNPLLSLQILAESNSVNIGTFHGANTETFVGKSLETLLLPFAKTIVDSLHGVIAVSPAPAGFLKEFYDGEIHIVPNGINPAEFNPQENKPFEQYQDGKINILFLGRLDKRKGVIYLLKAFRKIRAKRSDVRLLVAGKGDEFEKLQKYIKKFEIPDVEMLGFVKESDKPRWYATCDIFCSPAMYGESFGIVLLEAMASGKPVVAASNPGYRSVLIEGKGGLLMVPPKNVSDLADKLDVLSRYEDLRMLFGKWGIEEVERYSWDKVAQQVQDVYEKIYDSAHEPTVIEQEKKRGLVRKFIKRLGFKTER